MKDYELTLGCMKTIFRIHIKGVELILKGIVLYYAGF